MITNNLGLLKKLAIFSLVVERGSFAAAALAMASSRSRTSEAVAGLEAELRVRLLNRTTRKLSLTAQGEKVYRHARKLQVVLQDILEETDRHSMAGTIKITCTQDIGVNLLAKPLAEFETKYPEVSINLVVNDDPLDLVDEDIDVAIRGTTSKDESFIGRPLYKDSLQIFAAPDYLERYGTPTSVYDLSSHQWILLDQLARQDALTLSAGEHLIEVKPEKYHRCDSILMMHQMLVRGMGLGLALPITVTNKITAGSLVAVLPEFRGAQLNFYLAYLSRKHLPLRTRRFIDFILKRDIFAA